MVAKAAEFYKKLGEIYLLAGETAETAEAYVVQNKNAISAYNEAVNLFNQKKNKAKELECRASTFLGKGYIGGSLFEVKKAFSDSWELFIESSEFYSKDDDQESMARTLSRAALVLSFLGMYSSEKSEIDRIYQKGIKIVAEAVRISKDIGNIQLFSESLIAEATLNISQVFFKDFKRDKVIKKNFNDSLSRAEEALKFIKECEDPRALGMIHFIAGNWYCIFASHFIENEAEQRKWNDKGLMLFEKALTYLRKANFKSLVILSLHSLNWWALFGRKFKYVQKRILNDVKEILELGKIYSGVYSYARFYANLLPIFYYANMAQRSFFKTNQRISYAKQGIKHAKDSLKVFSSHPISVWYCQMLTYSYSQLTALSTSKDERNKYAEKMAHYAQQAEEMAENFEGGLVRAVGYSSLYIAHKTLADLSENKEDKIKMLSVAADASKKYIEHTPESKTGILIGKIRLGLLYEEISIIKGDTKPLIQAKELFLDVIRESIESGYPSYVASTYEYMTRIEDRLGNHMNSAELYQKAREAYFDSLNNIEYKPLKNRTQEKVSYASAWNLIEMAKTYHKRENHLKAQESYEEASEMLGKVSRYSYEASYYASWAFLEEAEQLSKQEYQEKAIEKYEMTQESFENAIKTLKQASKSVKEKRENERIEKLEKVAKIRMNYCSARIDLEEARILGKQGQHLAAAEKFAIAASQFRHVCTVFKIERERRELEAIYYLCRAWESMELASKYEDSVRFAGAANLFKKASNLFTEAKLKLLASGNSAFCQALEYGCKFDESIEKQIKTQLYQKIKIMLRKAASSYDKAGFESGADWALATSTYFDAAWHLIRADEALELDERQKLLGIGFRYLTSAAELFSKAGYKEKEEEIQKRLNRLKKEEKILVSALNTIKEPSISKSTVGIVAPSCPIEIGHSTRLSEVREIQEEERRVIEERVAKRKYELVYRDLSKQYPKVQKSEFRVGIAQIGVSTTGDILNEFYEMRTSGLLGLREDKVEIVRSNIKKMVENANKNGVNILLFPEMTVDFNYSEFLEEISDLAKLYEMYIVPGSYHDQKTKRNLSMVIGPDGILWEQEKHIPALIHIEGKRFKEGIETGTIPRKTIVCNTEYGRIAVAICRDFLDMDLRVELKNFEPPVDIILNPAFTPVTADFRAAHFDARRSIYAYCFFANVAEFGDSLIYTPEKERIERTIPPKEEDLIYKDVDLFKLRSERKKWEREQKKEKPFIQSTR